MYLFVNAGWRKLFTRMQLIMNRGEQQRIEVAVKARLYGFKTPRLT
ncbi:hypothetical protein M514_28073 [Trichuris suis]|uniref:Uncharacterized protein n=1 Tax=Trichuris suis TaxID=68888 RepID=A0A085MRA1_9BILA|nr:hypothetical protein M514_28073 [Trichuris suis]